jgi:ribulose-5-phosphate 4-epimerase/fuculose-1-phosphate aldolase
MSEQSLRKSLVRWGRSMFERGLTAGSSGNMSVKLDDGYLFTPTNSCMGFLDAARISKLDRSGALVSGDPPTKELPLHFAFYESRPLARAVVHLHSGYATALSCLADVDPENCLPPATPYVVMRVGTVPLVPYTRPGSAEVAPLIHASAPCAAVLLGNHGPVVSGTNLDSAVYNVEEMEDAAKLAIMMRGQDVRYLTASDVADLEKTFNSKVS